MPRKRNVPPTFRSFKSGPELRRACQSGKVFILESTGERWAFKNEVPDDPTRAVFENDDGATEVYEYMRLARA